MSRVIRNERHDPDAALANRRRIVREVLAQQPDRVLLPYYPAEEMPAGDPASEGGERVAFEELTPELQSLVSSGGGSAAVQHGLVVSLIGQAVFPLPSTPFAGRPVVLYVNGLGYTESIGYFSVAGAVLTWVGPFILEPTDLVSVVYFEG